MDSEPMTDEELAAIDARRAAITSGEWRIIRYDRGGGRIYVAGDRDGGDGGERRALVADMDTRESDGVATAYHEGDREFFFHAPSDVARLRAEVDRLRGMLRVLGDYVDTRELDIDHPWEVVKPILAALCPDERRRAG